MRLPIPVQIKTERLVLQRFRQEDAEEIFYTYASKLAATKFMSWPTHESIKDTRDYLKYAIRGWKNDVDYSFGIRLKSGNRLIGACGLVNDQGKIQFGYVLGPGHWGNGFATEATNALLDQIKNIKSVYRINTFADVENAASIKVLEKCGLVKEVVLEKWFRFPNQNNQPKDCFLFRLPLEREKI